MESWKIVTDIVSVDGNVYSQTSRYNYGPVWFNILSLQSMLTLDNSLQTVGYYVTAILTLVDLMISAWLFRIYGLMPACIFLINPVSIIITGYHRQFDNIAFLLGAISVTLYSRAIGRLSEIISLITLGFSLATKHILFLFPLWMYMRNKKNCFRLDVLAIPYLIFAFSFLFYINFESINGIVDNVFLYRSFNNSPLIRPLLSDYLFSNVPKFFCFIALMIFVGYKSRSSNLYDLLNKYSISLVIFSSAIANQYLAICVPAISTRPKNLFYFMFSILAGLFLIVHHDGLHVNFPFFSLSDINVYSGCTWLLLIGLVSDCLKDKKYV
ncbi:MAG: hypothetical protein EoVTN8_407 [Fluviibacter phosphoraccumulans EoVTN8]